VDVVNKSAGGLICDTARGESVPRIKASQPFPMPKRQQLTPSKSPSPIPLSLLNLQEQLEQESDTNEINLLSFSKLFDEVTVDGCSPSAVETVPALAADSSLDLQSLNSVWSGRLRAVDENSGSSESDDNEGHNDSKEDSDVASSSADGDENFTQGLTIEDRINEDFECEYAELGVSMLFIFGAPIRHNLLSHSCS